jgi:hypothetical protein
MKNKDTIRGRKSFKPELYIHIGTHKTGSSAIQNALHKSEAELKKEKIIYIHAVELFKNIMKLKEPDDDIINSARTFLIKETSRHKNKKEVKFVISFEGFSGNIEIGYTNSGIIAEILKGVTAGFDVKIIVYLRRQDLFIESLYTQMIQQGHSFSFQEYINSLNKSFFSWKSLLDSYKSFFGYENIIVRRYGKEFFRKNSDIIKDFGEIIGSDSLKKLEEMKIGNPGYSRDALEIARLCNPLLNNIEKRKLRLILQTTNPRKLFDNFSFFNNEERKTFLSNYSNSNFIVAREYFKIPEEELFINQENNLQFVNYDGLTLEKTSIVLTRALIGGLEMKYNESIFINTIINIEKKLKKFIRRNYLLKKISNKLIKKLE